MSLYHVTKFPPYFPFTLYCFYTKISSFMPVLTKGIVRDCFYLLIFNSEKFSTWICSIKWPLVSIPRVTVRLRVTHHWRYFCFQKIPRFFNSPAKTALSDQNGAECLGQYRHSGSSSLKLRTIVDKSLGTTLHRLRVVPHFSSGRVERAKRERFAHSTIPEGKWGTTRSLNFAFLGRFPIHTSPTPPLTPQTMLDACIQNFFRI